MNSQDVRTHLTSNWLVEPNSLPVRVIMWSDPAQCKTPMYVTHLEVKNENDFLYFILGHYDMTLYEAVKDFQHRCETLRIVDKTFDEPI